MEEVKINADTVPLEPFVHQVSGHSTFQQFDKSTVCKPLFFKELKFYQEMPSVLKPFIPQFKGVVTAQLKEDCQGNLNLIVHPNRSMFIDNCDIPRDFSDSDDDIQNSWGWGSGKDCEPFVGSKDNPKPQKYLMLENIICRYHHPSILDLKMGTQIHSDYKTSEEEMQRRRKKWEKTTASTLGVRIGGMKVYRVDRGGFLFKNKSEGSRLTDQGFEESLAQFFHNGKTLRCELIDCFMRKLERFLELMEKDLSSYRFYNSSLLLVYEGDVPRTVRSETSKDCSTPCNARSSLPEDCPEQCTCRCGCLEQVDIRMIDFAHVSHNDNTSDNTDVTAGPDKGYIFGLKSLIRILRKIQRDNCCRGESSNENVETSIHMSPCAP